LSVFFFGKENCGKTIEVLSKSDKNNGTLHEDRYTFFTISRSFLIRMKNVSDISRRDNQNTHVVFSNFENRAVYEIMWINIAEWNTL